MVKASGDMVYKMPVDDDSAEYYGLQVSGGLVYKMYSDVNLNLSVTHFNGKEKDASRT